MLNQISTNPLLIVIATVVLTLIIMAAAIALLPKLAKKGVNVGGYINAAENAVNTAATVIDTVDKVLPANPVVNILKLIETYAKKAVDGAEQLYISSKLPADQRNTQAKDTVYAVLKSLGVQPTADLDKIIDGAIEAEVLALGHKTPDAAAVAQAQQQLQSQVAQLQQQNAQLKQTLNTIQSTVAAAAPPDGSSEAAQV